MAAESPLLLLLLTLAEPALPGDGFAAAAPDAWPAAPRALATRERDGSELRVVAGRLVRSRVVQGRVQEQLIGCTRTGGPGPIRSLATHRDGTTWVAAEHGVFVLHHDVAFLDPLELLTDAPSGAPVELVIDARGRVWIATETQLWCLRPEWISGCRWTSELPPGPLRALAYDPTGDLWLRTDQGAFRYRPHQGEVPQLRATLAGRPVDESAVAPTGELLLQLSGGVDYRYRFSHHHVWYPVAADARVTGLRPGHHVLEFVALDRDANASPPVRVVVDVPYPPQFDRRLLLAAVALFTLLVAAAFGLRARQMVVSGARAPARALAVAALSTLLVVALALLVAGSVAGHGRTWPFLGYSMYTQRYREGSALFIPVTMGIRTDGSMVEIDPSPEGEHFYGPWEHVVPLIQGGDAACRRFLAGWHQRNAGVRLRGLQVRAERFRLTAEGPRIVAPLVLHHYEPAP